ncbi:DUF6119 family protein [Curtobacterium oceanosedimentum]|uniref:DUF6119 family protein n=1 Tax=Curtobacterium oceanosedimentum TaxID=465820 RepID=UPI00137A7A9B|nr:DUF6119 family protein [Curtobacterium oceanosedimentum]
MSIYLLKEGFDGTGSLIEKHGLVRVEEADAVPATGELWSAGIHQTTPWWQGYFGLPDQKQTATLGAILFLEVEERFFALTFGQTSSRLRDDSYEYDFGLRVSLNAVDPEKLKSTDTSEPGAGRRQRTQTGADSALTFFDFDSDSSVMKSITGKAKEVHEHLVRQVTGSTNLRVSTLVNSEGLADLCSQLLELYLSDDYRTSFPAIDNLRPVKDPKLIDDLDCKIDISATDAGTFLMLPEVVEYNEDVYFRFAGAGSADLEGSLEIEALREQIARNGLPVPTAEDLRRMRVLVTDGNGDVKKSFGLYRCLNVEIMGDDSIVYILHDGAWFRARRSFVEEMQRAVDEVFRDTRLSAYNDAKEADYNSRVADGAVLVNLDRTNVAGAGRSQIEPADLLRVEDDFINLYHVKVSTRSSELSHLFNQGLNSAELLLSETEAAARLQMVVDDRSGGAHPDIIPAIHDARFAVRYVIATRRPSLKGHLALPFFSQITLWRVIRAFKILRIPISVEMIENVRPQKPAKPKERKERSDKGSTRTKKVAPSSA